MINFCMNDKLVCMNTSSYAFFPNGILEKYFIPYNVWLNKWREQQIKSILDD